MRSGGDIGCHGCQVWKFLGKFLGHGRTLGAWGHGGMGYIGCHGNRVSWVLWES